MFALNELSKERNDGGDQDHNEHWVICGYTVILGESLFLSESQWKHQGFIIVANGGWWTSAQLLRFLLFVWYIKAERFCSETWRRRFSASRTVTTLECPFCFKSPLSGGCLTPSFRELPGERIGRDWKGCLYRKDVIVPALVVRLRFKKKTQNLMNPVTWHISQHWHPKPLEKDFSLVHGMEIGSLFHLKRKTFFIFVAREVNSSPKRDLQKREGIFQNIRNLRCAKSWSYKSWGLDVFFPMKIN